MPNGSLDALLFSKTPDSKPLSWDQRYNIISRVASALNYLHNEYDQKVVHRDLKAGNIMLDFDFNARLGDFGLARALDKEKTSYSEVKGVAGTLGYIALECFLTGKATQQSDVYAFGVVLLEIVCGLRTGTRIGEFCFLVNWVWSLHREGHILDAVEERIGDECVVEEAKKVLILALACCHPIASGRLRTQAIVHIISDSKIMTDFGLPIALDEEKILSPEAGGVAGTLGHVVPECFLTGKATKQPDVYAFGVVLWEIVCRL
ncbi:hypothetical protein RHMOL_Rhmol08G0028600 [Rhododendron molle]|uniref:Uncharacterized protein n=1 Tax=Rhododendron molle TaxID=49168 RepID=A0ACC0MKX6_RHOML|nr:hypothetical protein RHMOL_Rhmol08G0028600 [Rhododendron molle]